MRMSRIKGLPVDMSDTFYREGWEYCKYLITDPRSDVYLRRMQEISDESTKLAASFQEGCETKT